MLLKQNDPWKIIIKNTKTEVGITLPGIIQSLSVGGEVLIDNSGTTSGNTKLPKGFKEKTISIDLLLLNTPTQTYYKLLKEIEKLFREKQEDPEKPNLDSNKPNLPPTTPVVYQIINTHINNRGVDLVIFSTCNSSESQSKDYISLTINFEEIIYPSYQIEELPET